MSDPIILRDYIDEMLDEADKLRDRISYLENILNIFATSDNWTYRSGFMIWTPDVDPVILAHRAINRKVDYDTTSG